ncbi:helix-turn-helix domain-containing protein [Paenibacillus eucommiae]|uniref:AraC-like DNA-binding protein n=1 Tax=Paenibacillus eucommiae TaxID=1355755 RepID=A0ABS4IP97_9BACL|nr:AraC family transcriptional regulator [Paenibacillus eucommiae]MBP1989392.1 AraC-like DNA-binding protein [Paenibacillus eucommiae]
MPKEMGEGYWQRIRTYSSIDIVICDVRFHKKMTMSSKEGEHNINLGFCLGDSIRWSAEGRKGEFGLDPGEVSAYGVLQTSNRCQYDVDRHFQGLTLKLNHMKSIGALQHLPLHKMSAALSGNSGLFNSGQMTSSMKRIVHDIIHCHYEGDIKHIYLEGKVLELFAVYLNEAILEKNSPSPLLGLSRTDIANLQRAKDILDADLISPPSLSELAKLAYLNEFKLKKGFKLLFGLPVHAYVISRRLEVAFDLLEEGSMKITEAAYAAGFGKAGHFSEQFKRKYGVNPSEYFSQLRH